MVSEKEIWQLLEQVSDPEVPVLTVVDLGVVRTVEFVDDQYVVTITPTYSGCPAMQYIEKGIAEVLSDKGIDFKIATTLSPAWTTDWLSEAGREKLRKYGIAPPVNEGDKSVLFGPPIVVPCPLCGSENTKMVSQFGSTACKAHWQCKDCLEPFDYFKCLR